MMKISKNDKFEPPDKLDGALVILWAYNPVKPFFIMKYTDGTDFKPVHGFAICRYEGSEIVYKFSCDIHWNVIGDIDAASIEEAVETAQKQTLEPITWNKKRSQI